MELIIVATSFDSYEDVITKYPESKSILLSLRNSINNIKVEVVHNVNAVLLHEQLYNSLLNKMSQEDNKFDLIIFNHPHVGYEDICIHQSLLAHFFNRYLIRKFIMHLYENCFY